MHLKPAPVEIFLFRLAFFPCIGTEHFILDMRLKAFWSVRVPDGRNRKEGDDQIPRNLYQHKHYLPSAVRDMRITFVHDMDGHIQPYRTFLSIARFFLISTGLNFHRRFMPGIIGLPV